MANFYVYALADPRDGLYRYVGGAYGNANRVNMHTATRGAKCLRAWLATGVEPIRKILFTCDSADEVCWAEPATWRAYKTKGHPLLNKRPVAWPELTTESRAKMSAARKGKKLSPETIAKLSAVRKGKKLGPLSAETIAKRTASRNYGPLSDEQRSKISVALKGKKRGPQSAEHIAKLTAVRKGKKRGPYHRRTV